MKNRKHFSYLLICLVLAGSIFSSCKKDSKPAPTASFIYAVNGLNITFSTTQTDASSFAWNFGDTTNVTAVQNTNENPTHVYKAVGTYTVTLIATGDGGSITFTQAVTTGPAPSGIHFNDNSFADWDAIAVAWKGTDTIGMANASTLQILKLKQTKDSLYVYLETTSKMSDSTIICMFFDTDNSAATGYQTYMYDKTVTAMDYVYQGTMFLGTEQNVQQFTGATASGDWLWNALADTKFTVFGHIGASKTTPANTAIEFCYVKAKMEAWDKKVTMGIYESDKSWSEIGMFPSRRHVPNKPLVIDLTSY